MKKTCFIHQQQGIGDIIFIQKIVRKYGEQGFNVVCPILIQHRVARDYMSTENAHYPLISEESKLLDSFDFAREYIDLVSQCESDDKATLFTKPVDRGDYVFLALGPSYRRVPGGLMQSKYALAGIDWSDWQDYVKVQRNVAAEQSLLRLLKIEPGSKYTLINEYSSNGRIEIKDPGDAVYMRNIKRYTLFDWIGVLENCSRLITVDTSLVLLAEVFLKKNVNATLISKWPTGAPSYAPLKSALRLPWNFASASRADGK